jgi:transcriptional accessory protein Tex/SPT6
MTKFGAFARLVDAPDIEGLIHISELSDQRVNHPREVVKEGEKLTLRVVKVDVKNRRLGLSLKRVNSAEYLDVDMNFFADTSSSTPAASSASDDSVTGVADVDEIVTEEQVVDEIAPTGMAEDVVDASEEADVPSAVDEDAPAEEDENA